MAARTNYVKIGLFVLLGLGAIVAMAVVIGVQRANREVVSYYTYFNESVAGLDVGAPVQARGVTIGQVGQITFGPDHQTVEVRCDLDVAALVRFGFRSPEHPNVPHAIPSNVRAQLASQGLTGIRFIALDLFDEKTNPPPELSFRPPARYIPAARSVQKSIEESIRKAMDDLTQVVGTLAQADIGGRAVQTSRHADEVLHSINQLVQSFHRQDFPQRTAATMGDLRVAIGKLNKVLDRVDGETGLIATTQRSISSFGEVGRNASETTRDLDATLREIRAAAEAVRQLADAIEREPDMLLKGRAKGSSR